MKKSLLLLALSAGMCILLSSTDFEAMPPPAGADLSPFIMTGSFCAPLSDAGVTDQFGWRFHPQELCLDFHSGIDLSAESGTPIRAFMSGTADIAGTHESYGKYIRIDHGNGFFTLYAHCSKLLIRKGETVRIGQCIAKVGQTGQATGPHLHFEMIMNSTRLDPLWVLGDIPAIQETL
ncbi:MAG: M23 family metallopeptidase [Oscillospiraceae bacterium]|nr:M23 family metallopeptidase [Oscillospiraceae bacterium]